MSTIGNIVCKTIGLAGVSAVIYDAYKVGKSSSLRMPQNGASNHLQNVYAQTRTMENESYVGSAIQNKVSSMRMNNPILPILGKIRGFKHGVLTSLGTNVIPVIFSCLAILSKGFLSKVGAWGLVACGLLTVLVDGFGAGKKTPMDKV